MTSQSRRNFIQWVLGIGGLCLLFLLVLLTHLSLRKATDQHNLRYLMWKAGLRDYDASNVLPALRNDYSFRQSLRGITISDFQAMFPNTFRITPTPSEFGKDSTFMADDPAGAHYPKRWVIHFRNGKLESFYNSSPKPIF